MNRKLLAFLLIVTVALSLVGCAQNSSQDKAVSTESAQTVKDLHLTVGTGPGPVTYPLAYMTEQNSNIVLKPWQNGAQLLSMLSSKEVQLSCCPVSNALITYNKGLNVSLLTVSAWGMIYVMSTEQDVSSLQDLKGKEIAVNGQGGLHDLIFQHLLKKNNIDPEKDLTITYMEMSEASSMLAAGKIKYALLNEPNSSIAALNAQRAGVKLNRVMDLTKEWNKLPGQESVRIPMGCIVVLNGTNTTPEEIVAFEKIYMETSDWVNNHPNEIGPIVEKYLSWMKAAAVTQSIQYARLQPQHAADCKSEVEAFFKELSTTADMKAFGGKLPDAGFYYQH